ISDERARASAEQSPAAIGAAQRQQPREQSALFGAQESISKEAQIRPIRCQCRSASRAEPRRRRQRRDDAMACAAVEAEHRRRFSFLHPRWKRLAEIGNRNRYLISSEDAFAKNT